MEQPDNQQMDRGQEMCGELLQQPDDGALHHSGPDHSHQGLIKVLSIHVYSILVFLKKKRWNFNISNNEQSEITTKAISFPFAETLSNIMFLAHPTLLCLEENSNRDISAHLEEVVF